MAFEIMKFLIVLRCGDQSLHPQWVDEHSSFDTILSYYGDNLSYDLTKIKYVHHFKGSKWEGLYHFFAQHKDLWEAYDYICVPDDDLSTTSENLNEFFHLMDIHNFDLAQPSLTHNSYYSHPILLQVKGLIYRETNFVEVMTPCFSRQAFLKCWETFSENKSGWGLDVLWPILLEKQKIDVIDITPVFHTRPVGIAGHGMSEDETSLIIEMKKLLLKYKIKMKQGCFSGLTLNGEKISNKEELLNITVKGCSAERTKTNIAFKRLYNEIMHPNSTIG